MNFNFFDWVRDGVKRSVLLGVSDAVETMGMPTDEESSKDKILSFLQDGSAATKQVAAPAMRRRLPSAPARKLGRSITEIHTPAE
ncbi:MAG: hypothetical protein LBQ54_00405 [Planctomycetaceae bacterium]|jgi:hypothetical protein|nr:hypothetical protein [Planctomycetaceae bacterium]